MKAKIKETGEIVEVENLYDDGTALVGDMFYKVSELDFDSVIDWEQIRIRASIAAMQGLLSNSRRWGFPEETVKTSIEYADALIEELKKRK